MNYFDCRFKYTENLTNLIPMFSLVLWFLYFFQHLSQEHGEHETEWVHQYGMG